MTHGSFALTPPLWRHSPPGNERLDPWPSRNHHHLLTPSTGVPLTELRKPLRLQRREKSNPIQENAQVWEEVRENPRSVLNLKKCFSTVFTPSSREPWTAGVGERSYHNGNSFYLKNACTLFTLVHSISVCFAILKIGGSIRKRSPTCLVNDQIRCDGTTPLATGRLKRAAIALEAASPLCITIVWKLRLA